MCHITIAETLQEILHFVEIFEFYHSLLTVKFQIIFLFYNFYNIHYLLLLLFKLLFTVYSILKIYPYPKSS